MTRLWMAAALAVLLAVLMGCDLVRQYAPAPATPPSGSALAADSFVAVVPSTLRAGYVEQVSVSLFSGQRAASGDVRLTLFNGNSAIESVSARVEGVSGVAFPVPQVERGQYQVEIAVDGISDTRKANVRVEDGVLLFVETDKPIYKPGQTIHARLMTLDAMLRPRPSDAVIEAQDAKGLKVFRKAVATDDYGMATVDLPLSTEPNLGVWKLRAFAGDQETQLDVRVEEYVLPKYEVVVETDRSWVLAGDPIRGTVSSEYSFGKKVVGELEIIASRYVGKWEEFARFSGPIDGETAFELPAVGYVSGVPGAGGQGNVTLDVTVHEKITGYKGETTHLLRVAATPLVVKVIPESQVFKPGLDMSYLVITQTPDGLPVDIEVTLDFNYTNTDFEPSERRTLRVITSAGKRLVKSAAPLDAVSMTLTATADEAKTSLALRTGYSPSDSFIHIEQVTEGSIEVGDSVRFRVNSTREASNFYYEVLSRGSVIYTDVSSSPDIEVAATQLMAPSSRLLVYQILPNNEVAADYIPFSVEAEYSHEVVVGFDKDEARPGDPVEIRVQTQGESRVGLVAVDKSVFILAANRLNLRQVFDELERLYLEPRVELHDFRVARTITTRGARETFENAGTVVLTNKRVPSGEMFEQPWVWNVAVAAAQALPGVAAAQALEQAPEGLAEARRVRQFFPETWIWQDVYTDDDGSASVRIDETPDSITTWMLRAVGISKEHGLGIGESQLRVFQPFFLTADLPYSAIRGEEFPVRVALFNYLETAQEFFVEVEEADWFDLLDSPVKSISVGGNDIGGVEFMIRPKGLGSNPLEISARSATNADAVIKNLLVEPEGIEVEVVENRVISDGGSHEFQTHLPADAIEGSGRAYVALSGSLLTQSISGIDRLLRMPFGCGEQNMILFAPNVYVARYLEETGQLKPEVMAKAEHLMLVGYQRQLTYRRADGSFSAFGDSDAEGSLWLTALVLKTFAEAREFMYIDQSVLDAAASWIEDHQLSDGGFVNVGFVHHTELLGGLQGRDALTAFATIALLEAGREHTAARAVEYLEGKLMSLDDAYTTAITSYALEIANSARAGAAYDKLMSMAKVDEDDGLYWGADVEAGEPPPTGIMRAVVPVNRSANIETTGYALLALLRHEDVVNAQRAAKWLVGQRNALGGFGSTQDTIVSLQGLTLLSTKARTDVDMSVTLESAGWRKLARVTPQNADVLQLIEAPLGKTIRVTAQGRGEVALQVALRYNAPEPQAEVQRVFDISVDYGTDQVEVDDLITVSATIGFMPATPVEAGMVVLDVAVPTGFEPVRETVAAAIEKNDDLKRFEIAGRKVIVYIEDMMPGETLSFEFKARAKYPVRAKDVVSQVYSYYRPELRGEAIGGAIRVTSD